MLEKIHPDQIPHHEPKRESGYPSQLDSSEAEMVWQLQEGEALKFPCRWKHGKKDRRTEIACNGIPSFHALGKRLDAMDYAKNPNAPRFPKHRFYTICLDGIFYLLRNTRLGKPQPAVSAKPVLVKTSDASPEDIARRIAKVGVALHESGIDNRSLNALLNHGITTVPQLIMLSDYDLLQMRGFGIGSLEDVKYMLQKRYGISQLNNDTNAARKALKAAGVMPSHSYRGKERKVIQRHAAARARFDATFLRRKMNQLFRRKQKRNEVGNG